MVAIGSYFFLIAGVIQYLCDLYTTTLHGSIMVSLLDVRLGYS